jgi:cobalt-zinc-cadmium efflux system outer membrane protein
MTKHGIFLLYGSVVLLVMVLGSQSAAGAEGEARLVQRLDLPRLVQEAAENNPEIRAARRRWEAAQAVIPQVQTLPDPRTTLSYQNVTEREVMYGASQEVPFPGKLRLRGAVATRDAERLEQEYLAARLRIIARLKEAYYDLHFVHQSIEVVDKNKRLLTDFENAAQARYAVGRAVQQDVFRAQTEISRALARLAALEQRRDSLRAEVNRLLNRPPVNPLGTPPAITLTRLQRSLADLQAVIEEAAPMLWAQRKGVERGDQAIALARREYFPDFDLGVFGFRNETMRQNGYQFMVGIKIPLYYATKQRQGVQEALATRESAAQDLQAVRQDLLFRLSDNFAQVQRAQQLISILQNAILPQATFTLESAQAGYGVGTIDFLTLLNSLLTLQENQLELHGEVVEHEKAIARLEEILGSTP